MLGLRILNLNYELRMYLLLHGIASFHSWDVYSKGHGAYLGHAEQVSRSQQDLENTFFFLICCFVCNWLGLAMC